MQVELEFGALCSSIPVQLEEQCITLAVHGFITAAAEREKINKRLFKGMSASVSTTLTPEASPRTHGGTLTQGFGNAS